MRTTGIKLTLRYTPFNFDEIKKYIYFEINVHVMNKTILTERMINRFVESF